MIIVVCLFFSEVCIEVRLGIELGDVIFCNIVFGC